MEDIREMIKKVWPEWEVTGRIGSGAFATVYKAVRKDMVGTSFAAIKVTKIPADSSEIDGLHAEGLQPDQTFAYYEGVVKDYSAEIKLMDSVKGYTNIVAIDDYKIFHPDDETVWYIFIRMELLTPLVKKTAVEGMDEAQIIRLGIDLCTALDICRRHSIVHRDIKPENIFVNESGDYKLGDFGVARNLERVTNGMSRKGTPNYMAPEVYKSIMKEIDFSAASKVDIYSLGMVMYWLGNASRLPFLPSEKQIATPEDRKNAFVRRINGEALPPPQNVSPELAAVILKACSYEAADRYESAAAMRSALQALTREAQAPAPSVHLNSAEHTGSVNNSDIFVLPARNLSSARGEERKGQALDSLAMTGADRNSSAGAVKRIKSEKAEKDIKLTFVAMLAGVLALALICFGIYLIPEVGNKVDGLLGSGKTAEEQETETQTEAESTAEEKPAEQQATGTVIKMAARTDEAAYESPVPAASWHCSACGADLPFEDLFCTRCGKTILCLECGSGIPKEDGYCSNCGIKAGSWKCRNCGTICSGEDHFCTNCATERHEPGTV